MEWEWGWELDWEQDWFCIQGCVIAGFGNSELKSKYLWKLKELNEMVRFCSLFTLNRLQFHILAYMMDTEGN